jgi:arylformamidase
VLTGCYDLRYNDGPLGRLDVFPADWTGAPVHVFFHGGFWRGRDKSDYSYLAAALVPAGITTVVMNYDLCPKVSVAEIVSQAGRGLRWVQANAPSFAGDPDRITASGHSAGAHLIAMALATDRGGELLPKGLLKGAVLISGIYDLAPVPQISVNEQVRLDPSDVAAVSPMFHLPDPAVPLEVIVGGGETPGWITQSRRFA